LGWTRSYPILAAAGLLTATSFTACTSPKQYSKAAPDKPPATGMIKQVIKSTAVATARAPFASGNTGAVVLRERLHVVLFGNMPTRKLRIRDRQELPAQAGGEEFEAYLDREKLPARSTGTVRFYVDGTTFFPVYLKAIARAQSRVDVQTFIFDNDHFAVSVADALKAKSREVPVRVYLDDLGSKHAAGVPPPGGMPAGFTPPKDIQRYLTEGSKVEARGTLNPYMMADHTKLHIIDDRTAFVGGMNIGKEYHAPWHDLMARVEGPVVADLIKVYEDHWRNDTWSRRFQPKTHHAAPDAMDPKAGQLTQGKLQPLRVLLTDTSHGKRDIQKATLLAIRCASRRVWIETPYFSSDDVCRELQDALERGVDVRIIVPGDNESGFMESGNFSDLKKLIKAGAKVYACPGMTHLKATVCDDWAMFGSANYDTLSLRVNRELNLASSDRRMVHDIATRVFERDFRRSPRISLAQAEARGDAAHEVVADQL
jgi:phosphatidylserine/phosphatidylglycerophosphate/cardiolipin synthase-like enzyme